jgi:type IV pilus assembly protein PilZ
MALSGSGNEILKVAFTDKNALYSAYMSFVKGGGLFIATIKPYKLGDLVQLEMQIMDEKEIFSVKGKVIWITPIGAQGNRTAGIGVQFQGDEAVAIRNKIETYLAGALKAERPTNTM